MWFLQPSMTIPGVIMTILSMLMIIFLVLPLHECAHGWVASKLGDTTARFSGRLTLNPLSHIDPFGAVALLLFGFGWAKPVPINPRNFKNPKAGMAITALAGPVSNLLAAFVGAAVSGGFIGFRFYEPAGFWLGECVFHPVCFYQYRLGCV